MRGYIFDWFSGATVECVATRDELSVRLSDLPQAIVVIDYALSDFRSVDQLLVMTARFRQARWILFSNGFSAELVHRLSGEPHIGLLLKDSCETELREALYSASNGGKYVCEAVGDSDRLETVKVLPELTPTELEILKLIALGRSAKEIAVERISSIHTITTHKKNIFRKLDVNNVHEATKYALRAGLIELVDYYI